MSGAAPFVGFAMAFVGRMASSPGASPLGYHADMAVTEAARRHDERDPTKLARRELILAMTSVLVAACASQAPSPSATAREAQPDANAELARIEAAVGGRVGVFALDTASGRTLAHRADERFAMCSTFKWVLAAAAFARVDRGDGTLDERIPLRKADLFQEGSAVTSQHVADGSMTVEALARAAVTVSDNTAANLLLAHIGGPAGLTAFIRQVGDTVTRLDRNEPTLNANEPGDERDTTSPRAMVGLMMAVLVGDALKAASRERLLALLQACETGKKRLRAGLPPDWVVGDKTGTGNFAFNDVAIATPPGRAPILISAYMSDPGGPEDEDSVRHEAGDVAIARLVARQLAGSGRGGGGPLRRNLPVHRLVLLRPVPPRIPPPHPALLQPLPPRPVGAFAAAPHRERTPERPREPARVEVVEDEAVPHPVFCPCSSSNCTTVSASPPVRWTIGTVP